MNNTGSAWTRAKQQLCYLQPTAVCALGRCGLQKSMCWKWAPGFASRNGELFPYSLYTFFVLSWLFPRHGSLWLGSKSLFPFRTFFLPLYLTHTSSLPALLHVSAVSSLTLVAHSTIIVRMTLLLALWKYPSVTWCRTRSVPYCTLCEELASYLYLKLVLLWGEGWTKGPPEAPSNLNYFDLLRNSWMKCSFQGSMNLTLCKWGLCTLNLCLVISIHFSHHLYRTLHTVPSLPNVHRKSPKIS